jgi:Cu/Ag efflux protein CusF
MIKSLAIAALLMSLPTVVAVQASPLQGQEKTVTKQNQVTATATIRAIDAAARSVTLRSENGDEDTFTVGPDVQRFDQLKVGDQIKVTYYESLVLQLRKPGQASTPASGTLAAGRLKDAPGGAIGAQQTGTVTVKAVDMNAPSITVVTQDGRTMTRHVADKKNLEGVSPGDRIDITYSQAVLVSAERGK